MIFIGCSSAPEVIKEVKKPVKIHMIKTNSIDIEAKNYLENSKIYFNYDEFEKAIENGLIVYHNVPDAAKKEEALYIINESAEEIVQQVNRDLYIVDITNIKKRLDNLEDKYGVTVKIDKVGYQYLIYYDKEYYFKLKKINPSSEFVKKIELKHMARMGQFVTDPAYRFKEIINVTKKYARIVENNPDISYAPDILVRIADLGYFSITFLLILTASSQ